MTSFRLAGDDPLPEFAPGQFLSLRVRGAGDPAPVRTYSLSGDPDGGDYRISVKSESDGLVSSRLRALLHRGDRIEVAAPRGGFVLDDGTGPVLLISAGIGLTPVLAMLHRLASEPSAREVWWIHTTHDEQSHAFAAEAADLLARLPAARSLVYYTTPSGPLPAGVRAGRLTADVIAGLGLPADAQRLRLRPRVVHGRRRRRPRHRRPRPGPRPHRTLRLTLRRSTPASSGPTHRRPTSHPARPAPVRR